MDKETNKISSNFSLSNHSLFQKQTYVKSTQDIINSRINNFGDKIILDIKLTDIEIRTQVRKSLDYTKIVALSEDIATKGLIHPIIIMKKPDSNSTYFLLIGENRYQAFKHLKRKTIPCIVKNYTDNPTDIKLLQLAENMHRTDINPVELADALSDLKNHSNLTLKEIAKSVGRNIDSIKQYSRISKMTESEKAYHLLHRSTKNEILKYLANRDKKTVKPPKQTLIKNRKEQLILEQLKIKKQGLKKDSKKNIADKIRYAREFIQEAEKLLNI
ncbi:hypothetical protein DID75_00805 [Candidatus Marinamargulisbacteria bacterium SCGC AG-410-N11]|nr:hypothetical protein DID75_00805 [Candidatus Marinamargulisbacteria bacterium SCGC AG-410-N11]